ncbi:MAG: hypothetical protein WC307_07205 [Candidatus Nanoarchaeia archaeon]|jgi:hypothetical protein
MGDQVFLGRDEKFASTIVFARAPTVPVFLDTTNYFEDNKRTCGIYDYSCGVWLAHIRVFLPAVMRACKELSYFGDVGMLDDVLSRGVVSVLTHEFCHHAIHLVTSLGDQEWAVTHLLRCGL